MGARTSAEMIKVMEFVRAGMSGYAAAKQVGIELSTLYRSTLWKAYKAELEATKKENQNANS